MNIKEVNERVKQIATAAQTNAKVATRLERELYLDVLRAIATGHCENVTECASRTSAVGRIKFLRGA